MGSLVQGINSEKRPISAASVAKIIGLGVLLAGYVALCLYLFDIFKAKIPNDLPISAFGFSKTVHNMHDRIGNMASLLFIFFPVAMLIEAALVGWQKSSIYRILYARTPSIKLDLACLAASQLQIYAILKIILMFGLAAFCGKWINANLEGLFSFTAPIKTLPILIQIPIFYAIYTFFDYWTHRIAHTRIFWPFHRFHHSAEDFCMVTTMRQHPVDILSIFIINAPMAMFGASVSVMLWVNVVVTFVGLFQHSNIDSNFGFIGKWIIQSPNHHRKHHILDLSEPVGHFSMMPLWDRLFGTLAGDADQTLVIGVDKPYSHGYLFIKDVIRDYVDFWRGLFGAKVDPYDFGA